MVGDEPNRARVSQKMRNNAHLEDFLCRDTNRRGKAEGYLCYFILQNMIALD